MSMSVLQWGGRRAVVCGSLLLFLLGCGDAKGPQRATVTGTVTVDGKPLDEGTINFIPTGETQGPVAGGEIRNGTYLIAGGVCVGTNRVEIRGHRKTGRMIKPIPPAQADGMIEETVYATPPMYNSESILKATVEPGDNTLDFPLKSGRPAG